MSKIFKFIGIIFILQACAYEPIYLNENYTRRSLKKFLRI